jgi:L-amino acid N-acyltransferase YncA
MRNVANCTDTEVAVDFSIRKATLEDLDEIVAIWIEGQVEAADSFVPLVPEHTRDFYSIHLERQNDRFGIWVAEKGIGQGSRAILGWQALLPCRAHPSFEQHWAQSSTYISKVNRDRGVGRSLLSFVCKAAVQSGFSHIIGYVRADNLAPLIIIESLGWKRVGSIPRINEGDPELLCYAYAVPIKNTHMPNPDDTLSEEK